MDKLSSFQKYVLSIGATATIFLAAGYWLGQRNVTLEWQAMRPSLNIDQRSPVKYANTDMGKFWEVWDKVSTMSIDREKLTPEKMVESAAAGLVNALDDPYSMYLTQKQNKDSKQDLAGKFEGVGMELGYNDEKQLVVMSPIKDSPAQRAGVLPGDKIWKINDEMSINIPIQEAVKKIRGEKGTKVKLTIQQATDEPRDVEIIRDTITIKSVELTYVSDNSIARIEVNRFGDQTNADWDTAVRDIQSKGVDRVIVDLRNNPGGYFTSAVHVASEFMDGPVVMQEDYMGNQQTLNAIRSQRLKGDKVAVLINKGSASASEIVTGALKEKTDALIIGETSFGKGTVQDVIDFDDGSGIHITIAKWLTPEGNWVHKNGITPTIEVKDANLADQTDEVLDRAIEELKKL